MAGVISISSDEEQSEECVENPTKKIKTDAIICLDDEEEKKLKACKSNKDIDIIIESDEDIFCYDKDNDHSNITHDEGPNGIKTVSQSKDVITITRVSESKDVITITRECHDDDKVLNSTSNDLPEESKNNNLDESDDGSEIDNDAAEMFKDCKEMQKFINVCLSQIHNENTKSLFKTKIPVCKKLFDRVGSEYIQSESFKALLEEKIAISKKNSVVAISSFNDVYQHLKVKVRFVKHNEETSEASAPSPNKNETIIAKLEHALRKVQKVIGRLEEAEVNFDEDEDSNYIKMQRYRERAVKIYEKLCKYRKEDAHAERITYTRLDFSGSKFPEFNHAINKKFKNNSMFPTYYDVERCLKKVVKEKGMDLSEAKLKEEARGCFKHLGNLLQKRRKVDLLSVHSHYLTSNDDPAAEDKDLESKLIENSKEASSKINEICEKYVKLQEDGQEPKVSSDSDDSKRETTDDEDE